MSAHDRFESLAGAVLLGEATPAERTTFEAHAATCALCCDDASAGARVARRIACANESETWRPSQPIAERLRARRSMRARFTLGALGWAVALSLVLNVAFVSGVGSRVGAAFLSVAQPESNVSSTRIVLESKSRVTAFVPHASTRHPKATVALRAPIARRHAKARAAARNASAVAPRDPTIDDIPDVLAGVDLYGNGSSNVRRTVAHVSIPRCDAHASDDANDVAAPHPCRDATGRIEHEPAP